MSAVAPLAVGGALAGAAVLVATNDPAAPGSRFPACAFHAVTGLWCPGCGLTRACHQLFTGHPLAALQSNLFVPIVLAVVVGSWWSWWRSARGGTPVRWPRHTRVAASVVLPIALIVYGVLRNIPAAPFDALAP